MPIIQWTDAIRGVFPTKESPPLPCYEVRRRVDLLGRSGQHSIAAAIRWGFLRVLTVTIDGRQEVWLQPTR